jgi:hypothetical protein
MKRTKLPYPAPEVSVHTASGTCHGVTIKLGTYVQVMILKFMPSYKHSCNRELVLEVTNFGNILYHVVIGTDIS